jgi:electron transfer flavoprotein beta subunit
MKIVVCIESALDATQPFHIGTDGNGISLSTDILNPWDEFALEAAILQKEKLGCDLVAITIGEESSEKALRNAFAMGCDEMIRIDLNPFYLNNVQNSTLLAATIQKLEDVNLTCLGRKTIDFETGTLGPMIAEKLKYPFITAISAIEAIEGRNMITRQRIGQQVLTSSVDLPAVVSISKDFAEPRFPSFMGTRKAAKAPVTVWSLEDLATNFEIASQNNFKIEAIPQRTIQTEMINKGKASDMAATLDSKLKAGLV